MTFWLVPEAASAVVEAPLEAPAGAVFEVVVIFAPLGRGF